MQTAVELVVPQAKEENPWDLFLGSKNENWVRPVSGKENQDVMKRKN